jgi:SEC-C motif
MSELVTADDLLFTWARARWLEAPQAVAAQLLDAAAHPDRLDGVSAVQVLVRAADVLQESGLPEQSIPILRSAVADADPGADCGGRRSLATALAELGDPAEAESLAMEDAEADPPGVTTRIFVARGLIRGGEYERAQRMANDAVSAARSCDKRGIFKTLEIDRATSGRELVYQEVRHATGEGDPASGSPADGSPASGAPAGPGGGVLSRPERQYDEPPWPAVINGRLLWWPPAEYRRVIHQVPGVAAILGSPWPDHAAVVETALRSATQVSPGRIWLAAGDFGEFTRFVTGQAADPRAAATMTAYTALTFRQAADRRIGGASTASALRKPVRWPPRRRQPCWCGSGREYQQCHGADA